MATSTCLSQPRLDLGFEIQHVANDKPNRSLFEGSRVGVTLLVIGLHTLALWAVVQQNTPAQTLNPPVLHGAIVQQTAAMQPEPVVESAPAEPKPTEPEPQPEPVLESLPLHPEGLLASQPEPVQEDKKPDPLAKEMLERPPELAVEPTEPTLPASAPVTAPRADASHLNNPAPAYPMLSRRLREEGTVLLQVLIEADGRISELDVLQSSGYPRLDQAALEAVKQWRFEPARQGETAIAYRYQQPITFQLQ